MRQGTIFNVDLKSRYLWGRLKGLDTEIVKAMRFNLTLILASLMALGLGTKLWAESKDTPRPAPNIVLIVVDTLAANFIGAYHRPRQDNYVSPSPNIDRISSQAVTFLNAYSSSSWTKPAVASIFTGLYPSEHGVTSIKADLTANFETLPEMLKRQGYKSAGFVSHDFISPSTGYAQGFDQYKLVNLAQHVHRSVTSDQISDLAINFLNNESKDKFFLFLHYFDPHFNYFHHAEFSRTSEYRGKLSSGFEMRQLLKMLGQLQPQDIDYLKGLYEEEIAYTDFHIGRVLELLEKRRLDKNTILIITADHGEEFLEHGSLGHTRSLFQELIHVPLIVAWPSYYSTQQVSENVSTLDIAPTILDILGVTPSKKLSGQSLSTLLRGGKESSRVVYSEVDYNTESIKAFKISAIIDGQKAIFDKSKKQYEFFDLASDPQEKFPQNSGAAFATIQKLVEEFVGTHSKLGAEQPVSSFKADDIENLKSLGYL